MANPYSPYDPNEDEAAAFGGQLPAQVNAAPVSLSDNLRSYFSAQQGSALPIVPASGNGSSAAPPVSLSDLLRSVPPPAPAALPITPAVAPGADFSAALEDYANGQGGGAFNGQPMPTAVAPSAPVPGAPVPPAAAPPTGAQILGAPDPMDLANSLRAQLERQRGLESSPLHAIFSAMAGHYSTDAGNSTAATLYNLQRQQQEDAERQAKVYSELFNSTLDQAEKFRQWYLRSPEGPDREKMADAFSQQIGRPLQILGLMNPNNPTNGISADIIRHIVTNPDLTVKQTLDLHTDVTPERRKIAEGIANQAGGGAVGAAAAEKYLATLHEQDVKQAIPRVQNLVSQALSNWQKGHPNETTTIGDLEDGMRAYVDSLPDADFLAKHGMSKSVVADAYEKWSTSDAGKRWYAGRGVSAEPASASVKLTQPEMEELANMSEFKVWSKAHGNAPMSPDAVRRWMSDDSPGFNAAYARIPEAVAQRGAQKVQGVEIVKLTTLEGQRKSRPLDDPINDPRAEWGKSRFLFNPQNQQELDPHDYTPDQFAAAKKSGTAILVSKDERTTVKESNLVLKRLDYFDQSVIPQLGKGSTPGSNLVTGYAAQGRAALGQSTVATEISALRPQALSIVRAFIGRSNRMNQQEIALVTEGVMPKSTDSQEQAKTKMRLLRSMIEDVNSEILGSGSSAKHGALRKELGLNPDEGAGGAAVEVVGSTVDTNGPHWNGGFGGRR